MLRTADKGFGPQFEGFVSSDYINDTEMMQRVLQEWGGFLETDVGFLMFLYTLDVVLLHRASYHKP